MKRFIILLAVLLISIVAIPSFAAQLRLFVADINATGAQNRDEMKGVLQTLLASRLNGDKIVTVGSPAEADAVVSGTYISFGKIFSVDAVAKTTTGKTVARAFVQGENQDELIPSIGKLAEKLSAELLKQPMGATQPVAAPAIVTGTVISGGIDRSQLRQAPAGEFVKPSEQLSSTVAGWQSKRLVGASNLMAIGLTLADGSREVFLAEDYRLTYYRLSEDLKLIATAELSSADKIVSLDTIRGGDGTLDIYVSIVRSSELNSQVWQVKGDKLVLIAEKLPYYFRSASLSGGAKKLYAQAMGRGDDYHGDIAEASRTGSVITLKNSLKIPRYGSIYNFNQFRDREGNALTVVIHPDGYLIVYDQQFNEIWRSNDKFGGSELFFQREDDSTVRVTGDRYRWIFMNQTIQISAKNEILVGRNDGFWVLGNARSYKRGAVHCFIWNGSSLEEKWRTRETQDYMPDYSFDATRNELLILQTVQRPGITGRGASSLSIKKIE